MAEFKIPTEMVELPSQGAFYPEGHPLRKGTVEMKYMTAKEEDILTNQNYINKGIVIDKLLQALIQDEFDFNDLLIGDKNGLMVAARVLSYGKDYEFTYQGENYSVDLTTLEPTELTEEQISEGQREYSTTLPQSGATVTFKLLTHGDDRKVVQEVEGMKKVSKSNAPSEGIVRLKHLITSVNGDTDANTIRTFVDNYLLASDARALRKEYERVMPDLDLTVNAVSDDGEEKEMILPIGLSFFWPDL
jgi:hypothetical protein